MLVGMSGGVDSSVAAALLKGLGFELAGLSVNALSCDRGAEAPCCSARDREDARRVCEAIGIPHFTFDMRAEFRREVVEPFVAGYLAGLTPSPCVVCNEKIKFRALLGEAERLGFDAVATGHYARVARIDGRAVLLRAADERKDQSYFLCRLGEETLSRVVFPLGALTKEEVRRIAAEMGLPTRAKRESQEACFVSNEGCAAFVEERAGEELPGPGFFVDVGGKRLCRHRGIHAYTVGQRRGLGFGSGRRQYVVRIDAERNEVILGSDEELMTREIVVGDIVRCGPPGELPREASVKIRSTHAGSRAQVRHLGAARARVIFDEPVRAAAPGQAAVFYVGDEVAGSGWIER